MTIPLHLVVLEKMPIFEQLQLEEALLRADTNNYCLINQKSTPAIVMGISGIAEELIDFEKLQKRPVPIIRRFSGGGTVLIEEETLFVTFIFNRQDVDVGSCPRNLLKWTETILQPAFHPAAFELRENDYCVGGKKIGGNAQYFTKNRWLHHTSLLWDYSDEQMLVLKMPKKVPEYRQGRDHKNFLTRLSEHLASKEELFANVRRELARQFCLIDYPVEQALQKKSLPHRQATTYVS